MEPILSYKARLPKITPWLSWILGFAFKMLSAMINKMVCFLPSAAKSQMIPPNCSLVCDSIQTRILELKCNYVIVTHTTSAKAADKKKRGQCTYKGDTVVCLCNHYCHAKASNSTYFECVHAKRKCLIILSPVACLALSYFSTLSHELQDKMCVLIFSTTLVCNISHSKKNLARYDQKGILIFV